MERRKFVRNIALTAAGTVALPSVLSSCARKKASPNDRIEVALVGCGGMGAVNMFNLLDTNAVECVALCDVHQSRIQKTRDEFTEKGLYDKQKEYSDYRELLDKGNFDAAVIAVPDHWHAILYTEFANQKIDIYGEKPLVRRLREGRLVSDAVKKNKIIWQTGSWQRSTENFKKACELVASGVIGDVKYIEVGLPDLDKTAGMPPVMDTPANLDYDLWLGPAPLKPYRGILHWNWRWQMDYSGGQLTDWIGHHLDIATWALDLDHTGPIEIDGSAQFVQNDLFDVPRAFNIKLLYKNGTRITVANNAQLPKGQGVCWYGEKGWIHVNRGSFTASEESILTAPIPESLSKFRPGTGNHVENFVHGIRNRVEPVANVEAAHRTISAGLLGEVSYLTGEKLKWNPDTEELIGASTEANDLLSRNYRKPWSLKGLA